MILQCRIASVFGVHREAVEVLSERTGHRHRVGCYDVASEPHLAGCASLVALSPPCSLGETLVPGDLAAAGVHAILSSFRAGWHAGLDLNSFLLVLHARKIRGRPLLDCTGHAHQRCHTCCSSYQPCPPTVAAIGNHLRLLEEALLIMAIHGRRCLKPKMLLVHLSNLL